MELWSYTGQCQWRWEDVSKQALNVNLIKELMYKCIYNIQHYPCICVMGRAATAKNAWKTKSAAE